MVTRTLTAAGVLVSAAVHLWLWYDGFRTVSVIGPLFMVNAVAGALIAVGVMVWRHWVPLFLAVGFGACTLVAFLLSVTIGLFGFQEIWTTLAVVAALAEILALVAGAVALFRENRAFFTRQRSTGRSERVTQSRS
jgi:hypothetical protein